MKLLPEEIDLLISEHRNNAAHAESVNDFDYADHCRKRQALFQKAKDQMMVTKATKPVKARTNAPKPPKLT